LFFILLLSCKKEIVTEEIVPLKSPTKLSAVQLGENVKLNWLDKEQAIDLLKRVCTVSVETMNIIHQMPGETEYR